MKTSISRKLILSRMVLGGFISIAPLAQTAWAQTSVLATGASTFLNSLGVNTHFLNNQYGGAYANVSRAESQLSYIGVNNARDSIYGHYPTAILNKINHDIGTKFTVIVRGEDYASEITDLRANPQMLAAVEGPNEADNYPVNFNGASGYPAAVALQKQLYADVKNTPALAALPVYSLTLAYTTNQLFVGNLAPWSDYQAFHIYPQWDGPLGSLPYTVMQYAAKVYNPIAANRPSVITEGGWWTLPGGSGATEMVQAKYTLDFVLDAFAMGISHTYLYELCDEYADNGANLEYHFGLFRNDGTPKPAAIALHNMTSILSSAAPVTKAGALSYAVQGMPATGHQLLLQKDDYTYALVLWNDTSIWDNTLFKELTAATVPVTLQLGQVAQTLSVYDPMVGTSTISTQTNLSTLPLTLPDHPIVIQITPTTQIARTILPSTPNVLSAARGGTANISFAFGSMPMAKTQNIFVHFVNNAGQTVWQGDFAPVLPTTLWSGSVVQNRTIPVPANIPAGTYKIVAGLCDQLPPWSSQPMTAGAGVSVFGTNQFQVGTITVN